MENCSQQSPGKIFLKNVSFLYLKGGISQLVNIFVIIGIVRSLPVHDFGVFSFLMATVVFLQVFSTGSLLTLFQRFIPEYVSQNKIGLAKRLIVLAFSIAVPVLVLLLLLFVGGVKHLEVWMNMLSLSQYVFVFSIYAFLFLVDGMSQFILFALVLHKYAAKNSIVYTFVRATGFILVFYFMSFDLSKVFIVEACALFVQLILNVNSIRKYFWGKYSEKQCALGGESHRIFRYGCLSSFNEFGAAVLTIQADLYIISIFLGPAAVALYGFADRLKKMVEEALPLKKGYDVIRPLFFSQIKSGDVQKINNTFNFLLKGVCFVTIPVLLIVGILGDKIILYFFTEKYISAYPLLVVFLFYVLGQSFLYLLQLVAQLQEKMDVILFSKVFSIYNIVMDIVVLMFFGIKAVALVSLSALIFQNAYIYFGVKKDLGLQVRWTVAVKVVLNSFILGVVLWFMKGFVINGVLTACFVLLGVLIYVGICRLNPVFDKEERIWLQNQLGFSLGRI